jgi:rhodanese-related sulfurtransferase
MTASDRFASDTGGDVDVAHLRALRAEHPDLVVLDVRMAEELRGELGALDGILHIPMHEIPARLSELEPIRGGDVFVVCRVGNRSGQVASFLRRAGFRAHNVLGGMAAWRAAFGDENR